MNLKLLLLLLSISLIVTWCHSADSKKSSGDEGDDGWVLKLQDASRLKTKYSSFIFHSIAKYVRVEVGVERSRRLTLHFTGTDSALKHRIANATAIMFTEKTYEIKYEKGINLGKTLKDLDGLTKPSVLIVWDAHHFSADDMELLDRHLTNSVKVVLENRFQFSFFRSEMAARWGTRTSFFKCPQPSVFFISEHEEKQNIKKAFEESLQKIIAHYNDTQYHNRDYSIESLNWGFYGQDEAVKVVKEKLQNRLGGWSRKTKPLVLAFLGPSGTGKSELAKRVARTTHKKDGSLLRKEKKLIYLPMAQYMDAKAVDNLIGPPVGIQGEGQLTSALMQNPEAVIVLDEFEKANPDAIPRVFLQAFDSDNGFLKDTKSGEEVPTGQTIFILTSNMGAAEMEQLTGKEGTNGKFPKDLESSLRANVLKKISSNEVTNPFKLAEFRGRIDGWVIFRPFSLEERLHVAEYALMDQAMYFIHQKEKEKRMLLGWNSHVITVIATYYGGQDGREGIRPIYRAAQEVVKKIGPMWDKGVVNATVGVMLHECDEGSIPTGVKDVCLSLLHGISPWNPNAVVDNNKEEDNNKEVEMNGNGSRPDAMLVSPSLPQTTSQQQANMQDTMIAVLPDVAVEVQENKSRLVLEEKMQMIAVLEKRLEEQALLINEQRETIHNLQLMLVAAVIFALLFSVLTALLVKLLVASLIKWMFVMILPLVLVLAAVLYYFGWLWSVLKLLWALLSTWYGQLGLAIFVLVILVAYLKNRSREKKELAEKEKLQDEIAKLKKKIQEQEALIQQLRQKPQKDQKEEEKQQHEL